MRRPPEVIRALHTEAVLAANESEHSERGANENPEDRGVEDRVDGETDPEGLARQWVFIAGEPIPDLRMRLYPNRCLDAVIPGWIDK